MADATSSPSAADRKGGDSQIPAPEATTPPNLGKSSDDKPLGSPLCGVSVTSCTPDDDGTQGLAAPRGCATPKLADAGAAQGKAVDASTADFACRVTASTGPLCPDRNDGGAPNADLKGIDGAACETDVDCAPGFDCVAAGPGEKSNACRHYCCSASCDGVTSQNGGPTFCDVRPVVRSVGSTTDTPLLAPVCMAIKTCTLLNQGDCADRETCAIVDSKGTAGCVLTDGTISAKAGESCERKHCAEGLTCLGSPGDRTCYKLCRMTGGQECGDREVCTTSATFQDTSYGVCKTAE